MAQLGLTAAPRSGAQSIGAHSCFQALFLPSMAPCKVSVQTRKRYTLGDGCPLLGEKLLICQH